jgi:hypothetical protein
MANNLLDKSSIILTPTAYDNGKALCVKPSDGSGDFDFSRNSAATRVNAQGLVENVQILSSNLVQNGNFSEEGVQEISNGSFSQEGSELITNGDFSNGSTGWDLRGVTTVYDDKANTVSTSSEYILLQNSVTTIGKQYKITYDLVVDSGTFVTYYDTVNLSSRYRTTSGTYTEYFEAVSLNMAFRSVGNFTGSIDNVSCVEVGQDWTLGTGISIGDDEAIFTSVASGLQLAQLSLLGVSGKTYKVSYEIKSRTEGAFSASIGTTISANQNSGVGVYTEYLTATGTGAFYIRSRGTTSGSVTNISVKEVGMDWVFGTGWSIGDDVAIGTSATGVLYTNITITSSNKARIKADVNISGGGIQLRVGGVSLGYFYDNIDYVFTSNGNGLVEFVGQSFTGTITNISVIEITDDTNLPRINYENFSYQDALGSEEVVNGGFDDGGANWANIGNLAVFENSSVIFENNAKIYQNVVSDLTKTYNIEIKFSSISGNGIQLLVGNGNSFVSYSVSDIINNGNKINISKESFIGSGLLFIYSINSDTIATITSVSVKEYLGQEVVPNSGCGSWLFESQSTNLITQSELFSDASWQRVGSITTTDNYTTSPSGQNNATRLQWTNATNYIYQSLSHVGSNFTLSIYLKSNTDVSQNVRLFMDNGAQGQDVVVTTQWQRFEFTNTTTPTQSYRNVGLIKSGGQVGDLDISIWGAQFEALSYPTSLIPTSGSTVTRNQDVCTNGGSLATINSTEGVLYAEIAALANDGTLRMIVLNDGTQSNRVGLQYSSTNNLITAAYDIGGAGQASLNYTLTDAKSFNKIAFKYKQNDFSLYVNGIEVATDVSGNVLPANTLNNFEFEYGDNRFFFYGKTKALAVWKEALSDSELQSLTTI